MHKAIRSEHINSKMKRNIRDITSFVKCKEGSIHPIIVTEICEKDRKKRRVERVQYENEEQTNAISKETSHDQSISSNNLPSSQMRTENVCPHKFLLSILNEEGYILPDVQSSIHLPGFLEVTDERIKDYGQDCIQAVRENNIPLLRKMHNGGKNLQCSNRFGETLVHLACRRGLIEVVRFFIHEVQVSLRVRDDYGRTPLHDACWSSAPNFSLLELLIHHDPELLLIHDVRGHFPLTYTRKNHWGDWRNFLFERRGHMKWVNKSARRYRISLH